MFTGIIEDIGKVFKIKKSGDKLFYISTRINSKKLKIGSSISCNGVCLTIIKKGKKKKNNWFAITASKETLSKSNLSLMKRESLINLETSLRVGDEISGHLVFGHIDIKTKLISNGKRLAIIQRQYKRILYYSLKSTPLYLILDKSAPIYSARIAIALLSILYPF